MKTKLSSVLFSTMLAASALLTLQVRAEPEAGGPPPPPSEEGGQPKRQMNRKGPNVEAMREQLGLSDDQVAKLKEIFAAEAKEIKELRKDGADPTPEMREQAKAIREKYKAQIDAVLTPEQKAKADEARAARGGKQGGKEEGKGTKGGKKGKGPQDGPPPAE
jgi:Spy/CpxP family protein refolding chaperone